MMGGRFVGALREAPLREIGVGCPLHSVRPNVFPNFIQFIFIADNVIVKTALPKQLALHAP
jgi:hypothetical protein